MPTFHGDIIFLLADGTKILRLRHDGVVLFRGVETERAPDLIEGFRAWLASSTLKVPDDA